MSRKLIKIDSDFLENNAILGQLLIDLILYSSEEYYRDLKIQLNAIPQGEFNPVTVEVISLTLRNRRETSIRQGMDIFCSALRIIFDYVEVANFIEDYLVNTGEMEPIDVSRAVSLDAMAKVPADNHTQPSQEFLSQLHTSIQAFKAATASFMQTTQLHIHADELDAAYLVSTNATPVITEPRGNLRVVK